MVSPRIRTVCVSTCVCRGVVRVSQQARTIGSTIRERPLSRRRRPGTSNGSRSVASSGDRASRLRDTCSRSLSSGICPSVGVSVAPCPRIVRCRAGRRIPRASRSSRVRGNKLFVILIRARFAVSFVSLEVVTQVRHAPTSPQSSTRTASGDSARIAWVDIVLPVDNRIVDSSVMIAGHKDGRTLSLPDLGALRLRRNV